MSKKYKHSTSLYIKRKHNAEFFEAVNLAALLTGRKSKSAWVTDVIEEKLTQLGLWKDGEPDLEGFAKVRAEIMDKRNQELES